MMPDGRHGQRPPGTLPFAGVRVVEAAGFVFVPMATAILADLGADVIKVEAPGGDLLRKGRTGAAGPDAAPLDSSAVLVELANRSKRSIALDLRSTDGRSVMRRLIAGADVFATSFLPGVRTKLALDAESVRSINPSIVYATGSGWGGTGPMRHAPAFDLVSAWAGGGLASLLARSHGEPPDMPIGIFDTTGGCMLAGAIAAALYRKALTGEGSVVDSSLMNVGMWSVQADISAATAGVDLGGPSRARRTNSLVSWYQAADGRWLYFALTRSPDEFVEFCDRLGRPDIPSDPRFAAGNDRIANADALAAVLDAVFATADSEHWLQALDGFGGVWGPGVRPDELADHPQVRANGFVADHRTAAGESIGLVAPPMQFDGAPVHPLSSAPSVGQHSEDILAELGLDDDEIADLMSRGVSRST